MSFVERFLFHQSDVERRREYFIKSLLLTIITYLILGPYDSLIVDIHLMMSEQNETLFDLILRDAFYYQVVRYSCVLMCVLSLNKLIRKFTFPVVCLLLFIFQYVHFALLPERWNFNTHLLFFSTLITISLYFERNPHRGMMNSFSLSFPILYTGTLYLQAGLSKIIHSGPQWLRGDTILQNTYFTGTEFGRYLITFGFISPLMATATILCELSVIFLIISSRYRATGILLILLHVGIFIFMRISFWNLIALYPALFILGKPGLQPREHEIRPVLDGETNRS